MKKLVGEIKRDFLAETNIDVSEEKLRRYESMGLFSVSRNSKNRYREYSESEQYLVKRALMLAEIGVPLKAIAKKDTEKILNRINSIKIIMQKLEGLCQ